jgi:hypothetical protein
MGRLDFRPKAVPQEAQRRRGPGPLAGGGAWWDEERATDRVVVRVLLSDGAVVELARERDGWFLVGVAD